MFLEIKKKYNGIVNKRRTSIVLKDAYKYMESDVYPESDTQCINTQVLKEIDYFKKMYTLKPNGKSTVEEIFEDRKRLYEKYADITIVQEGRDIRMIVEDMYKKLTKLI